MGNKHKYHGKSVTVMMTAMMMIDAAVGNDGHNDDGHGHDMIVMIYHIPCVAIYSI